MGEDGNNEELWEKPAWTKGGVTLKKTGFGDAMKADRNLAAPITFTPFKHWYTGTSHMNMRSCKFSRLEIAIFLIAVLFFTDKFVGISFIRNGTATPMQSKRNKESLSTANLTTVGFQGSRGECIPDPSQRMAKLSHFRKQLDEPRIDPGEARKIVQAACSLKGKSDMHFPHTMQQLYRCFSFWQDYYGTRTEPVLILPDRKVDMKLRRQKFTSGIIKILEEQMQVKIVHQDSISSESFEYLMKEPSIDFQSFARIGNYSLRHVHNLHHFTQDQLELDDSSSTTCEHPKPRIAILNRGNYSRRSILNAPQLANHTKIKNLSRNNIVDIQYFEEADFLEQVTFFRSVDILISPHGAQLTGTAFMNAPCSHVLEIFPKGYALPGFFGSLALESGKDYSYHYLSENPPDGEQARNKYERTAARALDLCLSSDMMVDTIRKLADEWRQCCDLRERRTRII